MKIIDYTGYKFGKWTIIKKTQRKNGRQYYLLECECGKQKQQNSYSFKHSLMCHQCSNKLYPKHKKEYGYSSMINKLGSYKISALRRNLEWNLTDKEAIELMKGECHYCGRKPYNLFRAGSKYNGGFLCNGIDRIDNSKGYTIDNCCSCCSQCNKAKLEMTENEFLSLIKLIYNNTIRRNKKCDPILMEPQKTVQGKLLSMLQ